MDYQVEDIKINLEPNELIDKVQLTGRRFIPSKPVSSILLHHGAGAGFMHRFMQYLARLLAEHGHWVTTYNFRYVELGKKRPDHQKITIETIRQVSQQEKAAHPELPLFLTGKSYGGRMSSWAVHQHPDLDVDGLIYFGFPLHAPGRDSDERAAHLAEINLPMLFLQGTRDKLANLDLLTPVVAGTPKGEIVVIDGADHGFHVLKSAEMTDAEVTQLLANKADEFIRRNI